MPLILGLDPGFSSIGYAVIQVLPLQTHVVECGVIVTEKNKTKKQLVSEDNFDRAKFIHSALTGIMKRCEKDEGDKFRAITAESMSFPRSSSVAAKMAMCWGVIASIAYENSLPVLQITPQKIKKALTGSNKASKEEVQEGIHKLLGSAIPLKGRIPKTKLEHPYDALGSFLAQEKHPTIIFVRNMTDEVAKIWT